MARYEGYYASVVYTFLASLGFNVIAEDTTNTGRIDMTLITPQSIVIIEFKVDKSEEAALEQIKTNRYYEKYLSEEKGIYFIGIHFSSKTKNIEGFLWEKFQ
jgi:RecB family endonuclease NucS